MFQVEPGTYYIQPKVKSQRVAMLDEDEFEAEQRIMGQWSSSSSSSSQRQQTQPKSTLFQNRYNEANYHDNDDAPPVFRAPSAPVSTKRPMVLLEEDDDMPAPTLANRAMPGSGPIAAGAKPVPFRVQEAAALVLGFGGGDSSKLSQRSREELTMHYLQHPHEFYCVDPPIVCWISVDTGTIPIYCKEVVPVSVHLMALAFGAQFQLQITPKVKTPAQSWAEAIQVRPCRNDDASSWTTRIAPVGAMAAVRTALQRHDGGLPPNLDRRIESYMERLGKLDTREVCDPDWLSENVEELRKVCFSQNADDNTDIKSKLARLSK